MNNYQQIKAYCESKVIRSETVTDNNNQQSEQIKLRADWLTNNQLTDSPELTEVITRFYQSLVATLTPDNNYHPLPAYEDLISENYCTANVPNLGLKATNSALEPTIAQPHYQLLDQIIADSQQKKEESPTTAELLACQNQAQALLTKMNNFITGKSEELGEEKENPQDNILHIKKTLANYPEWQAILTEIKTWLVSYQELNDLDKEKIKDLFQQLHALDQAKLTKPKKDKKEKSDETKKESPAKTDKDKNQQELIYFGGFIIALIALVALLKSNKN